MFLTSSLANNARLHALMVVHGLAQFFGYVVHGIALGREGQHITLCFAQRYAFFLYPFVLV